MNMADPSMSLLAASGGDTVKLFDLAAGDPCVLSYSPSPGSLVNSVKWNHTNLVVASAGEDRRISLCRKNGKSMETIPLDSGDNIEESILAINFSNKGSRYICSGGTGQVVRIWDLQRKRCIKWLKGHTSTITGAMYNCKDEHLASVSLSGDLILHNLASGARATQLKDPDQQVLRVLDYSRMSRHLVVTSGDGGSIHLWDTTGRTPKISWSKLHSAPTAGISFSPSSDKTVASVGLDKKLYTYDTGSRRPSSCISYEAPFSSLAYRDDGLVLACGTGVGRVVFFDIRGRPQPLPVLRAYSSSEAVTSLCWQRTKPTVVNENCSSEIALLGDFADDSVVMPDPLPSVASSSVSFSTAISGSRNFGRLGSKHEVPFVPETMSGPSVPTYTAEETPHRSHLWPGGSLPQLNPRRPGYNLRDDMDVFSPVVAVQPITPSLDKLWDGHDGLKKENLSIDKEPSSLFPSSIRRFPFSEDSTKEHPISDWKSGSTFRQDNTSSFAPLGGTSPTPSAKVDDSITPPEACEGERLSDRYANLRQSVNLPSHFGMSTSSMLSNLQEQLPSSSQTNLSSLANNHFISGLPNKEGFSNPENPVGYSEQSSSSSVSLSIGTRGFAALTNSETPGSSTLPRTRRSYAERIGASSAFSDEALVSVASPKVKKTGAATRVEIGSSVLSKSYLSDVPVPVLPAINGGTSLLHEALPSEPQGISFALQLFQRTLEDILYSSQASAHQDKRDLVIEISRQLHMQEMEFSSKMRSVLENQAEMMKDVKSLRKEIQELRQLL